MAEEYRLAVLDVSKNLLTMKVRSEPQEYACKLAGVIGKGQKILDEIDFMAPISPEEQDSLIMQDFHEARRKILEITAILKSLQ